VLEEESVMRKDADKIVTEQIIERLHNAASQEEPGKRTPKGLSRSKDSLRTSNSVEAVERMLTMTVENIRAFVAGKPSNVVTPA
jgi:hypothetical protein